MSSSVQVIELGMGLRSLGVQKQKQGFKRFKGFPKQNFEVSKLIC